MEKQQGKIKIRSFVSNDIQSKINIINNESNNQFLHYDLPLKYDKTLNWYNSNKNNDSRLDLTILFDDVIVGFIGLLNIDRKNSKAEYYVCVDINFSGKGIASNATRLLLEYAFNEIKLEKIYLFTEKDNLKAQHFFEKIGFEKEGLLKNDIIHCNKMISRYVYGLCKGDFYE